MRTEELQVLRMCLKSGEYDGAHIMQAWLAIDELIEARKKIKELEQEVEDAGYEMMEMSERFDT